MVTVLITLIIILENAIYLTLKLISEYLSMSKLRSYIRFLN